MKRNKPKAVREDAGKAPSQEERVQFIERPDGVYWRPRDGSKEYGPFKTLAEAEADAGAPEDSDYEPGESLQEAENEIGVAEWVDPDTGAPAEESVPRIEDH